MGVTSRCYLSTPIKITNARVRALCVGRCGWTRAACRCIYVRYVYVRVYVVIMIIIIIINNRACHVMTSCMDMDMDPDRIRIISVPFQFPRPLNLSIRETRGKFVILRFYSYELPEICVWSYSFSDAPCITTKIIAFGFEERAACFAKRRKSSYVLVHARART